MCSILVIISVFFKFFKVLIVLKSLQFVRNNCYDCGATWAPHVDPRYSHPTAPQLVTPPAGRAGGLIQSPDWGTLHPAVRDRSGTYTNIAYSNDSVRCAGTHFIVMFLLW